MRLYHGPLDPKTRGASDRGAVWHPLPLQPHVAPPSRIGLEHPEAGQARPGTGREGHRPLEALRLAAYKKRPNSLGPTWSFSTKAAFFWPRPSGEPGLPGAGRRSCAAQATGPRSRPSRLSRFPRWIFHRFPGYAPELNPDEFVWKLLKGAVANSVPKDNAHLKRLIHVPLMRLRQSQKLLWSCIYASDLPWA